MYVLLQSQDEMSHILDLSAEGLWGMFFNLFNVMVIVAILSWLLYKPMGKFLADRKERIASELEHAANSMKEANEKRGFYEGKLVAIDSERDEILTAARKLAQEKESEIIQAANGEARLIMDRAKLEIEREREKAKDEMRIQIIQVSALMAEQLLNRSMDESDKERILSDALAEMGDAVWNG